MAPIHIMKPIAISHARILATTLGDNVSEARRRGPVAAIAYRLLLITCGLCVHPLCGLD